MRLMALRILGFLFLSVLSMQVRAGFAGDIAVGSFYGEVIEALGKPNGELYVGKKQVLLYGDGDARIVLRDKKVVSISPEVQILLNEATAEKIALENSKPRPPHPTAGTWLTEFAEAADIAKAENKKMLLNFTGSDWCGWCIRLDREVFSQREFIAYARENYVLVKLDFPAKKRLTRDETKQNKTLSRKYGIRGYPTIVVLNPSGEEYKRSGYVRGGPGAFLTSIR